MRIPVTAPVRSRTALVATVVPWISAGQRGVCIRQGQYALERRGDPLEEVVRRGRHLRQEKLAVVLKGHNVREGAADVTRSARLFPFSFKLTRGF